MKLNKKLSFVLIAILISVCLISAVAASDVNDTDISASDDISHANEKITEVSLLSTSRTSSMSQVSRLASDFHL